MSGAPIFKLSIYLFALMLVIAANGCATTAEQRGAAIGTRVGATLGRGVDHANRVTAAMIKATTGKNISLLYKKRKSENNKPSPWQSRTDFRNPYQPPNSRYCQEIWDWDVTNAFWVCR